MNPMPGIPVQRPHLAEAHVLRPNTAPVRLLAVAGRGGAWNAVIVGCGFAHSHPCCSERDAKRQARRLFWKAFPKHVCNAGCSSARSFPGAMQDIEPVPRSRPFVFFQLGHFHSLAQAGAGAPSRLAEAQGNTDRGRPLKRSGQIASRRPVGRVSRLAAFLRWGFWSAALAGGLAIALEWSAGG